MRTRVGTVLLLTALVSVFVVELRSGAVANDARLLALGALPDNDGIHQEYWRLLTFAFLHYDLTHFLLNTLLLVWIGTVVERRAGAWWLLLLFMIASVSSGIGILVKHHLHPSAGVSVGASGGLFGLLAAASILLIRIPPDSPAPRIAIAVVIILGLAYSFLPGISMVGHLVGLAVGGILAFVMPVRAVPTTATAEA